jgi:Holliday junction DNA helicase RuvA
VIGFIRGTLVHKEPPQLLVDVNGVGYELEAPMSTIFQLPPLGEQVQLRTHLAVRDDQQTLYAFATDAERRLFRNLMKVSGVGAKMSLTILSGISVQEFAACVHNEDKAALTRLPGVGRKTAERLIVEMRDRLDDAAGVIATGASGGIGPASAEPRSEAYNALVSLGYKPAEARRMLDAVDTDGQTTEDILRQVLRSAAP